MDHDYTVQVLHWRYGDGSAFGIVRAYNDSDRAAEDMELLNEAQPSKVFELTTVRLYEKNIPASGA